MYDFILGNLQAYERLVIFIGTLLWGDEVVYILSFLSGIGLVSVFNILIFGFLGNAGCDVFYFSIFRMKLFPKLIDKIRRKQEKKEAKKVIKKESRHLFFLLLLSKFFMGTRLVTLFYVAGRKDLSVRKFFLYNSLAVILWMSFVLSVLFSVGRFTGAVFSDVRSVIGVINVVFFILVGSFLVYRFVVPWVVGRFFGGK